MKKKVCRHLNSKEWGTVRLEHNKILTCCATDVEIVPEKNYADLTYDDIITARKKIYNEINENPNHICHKCAMLKDMEENEIDINKIKTLIYMPYTTCNFRCAYCYIPKEKLAQKPDFEKKNILPVLQNLKKQNVFKDDLELIIGGGEPMLINNIPEIVKFLGENFNRPILKFLSNSSVIPNKEAYFKAMKTYRNINRKLYTSIDAGTEKTYARLRGNNCFNKVVQNLEELAQNDIYDEITLKYILMGDDSNLSDKDIFGFCLLCKKISELNPNITSICIDADYRNNTVNAEHITNNMLSAAGKIYYVVTKLLGLNVVWIGGRLCGNSNSGMQDIESIKAFANNYDNIRKTKNEKEYLKKLNINRQNISFLQQIFSVKNENSHKVVRILGIKIKFRR